MTCSRCGGDELVGKVNGTALCFECYVETRPERPAFLPYDPVDEQRAQWAERIANGGTPVVIHVEARTTGGVSFNHLRKRVQDDGDDP